MARPRARLPAAGVDLWPVAAAGRVDRHPIRLVAGHLRFGAFASLLHEPMEFHCGWITLSLSGFTMAMADSPRKDSMNPREGKAFDLDETIALLARTPEILRAWLDGLPEAWLDASEGPGTFSPRDVVGHLIHGERTDWLPRLRRIREAGESKPFDPFDRVGFQDAIRGRGIGDLLDEFARLRRTNLEELASFRLQDKDLEDRGRHPAFGPVTVEQLLATWVTHDLNHLGQIARVMAKRHDRTVGPWKEYLGILHWDTRRG